MLADRPHGRRLTADEQRQLDDLEQRLLDDPDAPSRPRSAPRSGLDRRVLAVGLVTVAALLVLATVVGGPGGLAAIAVALLGTLVVWRPPRFRGARLRLRRRS